MRFGTLCGMAPAKTVDEKPAQKASRLMDIVDEALAALSPPIHELEKRLLRVKAH